jgi:lactoylglutathione lyase
MTCEVDEEPMTSPDPDSLCVSSTRPLVNERKEVPKMDALLKSVGAITLFVEDPRRSQSFYEEVFDLPVIWEDEDSAVFQFENTIVNLLKIPAARDLIEPGAVAGREAGSRFQLTIWVDDADAVSAELAKRGVELLNGPMNREWGMRTASFTDPDGHIWEIAQKLPVADGS